MRFGNASTTVTGTVTPASVNTRVMPHLRPTRPMAIVNPHSGKRRLAPAFVATDRRFGHSRPQAPQGPKDPRKTGVGAHALRPLKLDGEFYTFMPPAQVLGRWARPGLAMKATAGLAAHTGRFILRSSAAKRESPRRLSSSGSYLISAKPPSRCR